MRLTNTSDLRDIHRMLNNRPKDIIVQHTLIALERLIAAGAFEMEDVAAVDQVLATLEEMRADEEKATEINREEIPEYISIYERIREIMLQATG